MNRYAAANLAEKAVIEYVLAGLPARIRCQQPVTDHFSSNQYPPLSAEQLRQYNRLAKKGFLWLLSTTAVWQVLSWVLTLLTARMLLPEDYGLIAMNDAFFPYLMMFTTCRLDAWILQRRELSQKQEQEMFSLLLVLGMAMFAIGLAGAPLLALFYGEPRIQYPCQAAAIVFVLRALQVIPDTRLRRELCFKPIALTNLCVGVSRGILQLTLAYYGFAYWALVYGFIYSELVTAGVLVSLAGCPRKLGWNSKMYKEALRFGLAATVRPYSGSSFLRRTM